MSSTADKLSDPKLGIVFLESPAGLGHKRVADAISTALPKEVEPIVLGSENKAVRRIYHIASNRPLGRLIFAWLQTGPFSTQFNLLLRRLYRSNASDAYNQLAKILKDKLPEANQLLIIAAHFGLAQQVAHIKAKFEADHKISIKLVVVVTDDSFQEIWYADGADLIVVPSDYTKERLVQFIGQRGGSEPVIVLPYPVNPTLTENLTKEGLADRISQFTPNKNTPIHISIPVSGAAVGLAYYHFLIKDLLLKNDRFHFHVVSKESPHTKEFLGQMNSLDRVTVYSSPDDKKVVADYEALFHQKSVMSLEITKPSEQTFKALLEGINKGGVTLLLAEPVGEHEVDNLYFLQRHFLVPTEAQKELLWKLPQDESIIKKLLTQACTWRAVPIPQNPAHTSEVIRYLLKKGFLSQMILCSGDPQKHDPHPEELGNFGVLRLWEEAARLLDS